MEGLNPGEMVESLGAVGFQGGEINHNTSIGLLQDFEKKELLERVAKFELSDNVKYFVKEYDRIFGKRNIFLWKWLGPVYRDSGVMLSTVDKNLVDSVTDSKIIMTMLVTIFDDTADYEHDNELLKIISRIINNEYIGDVGDIDERILFTKKLWDYFLSELRKYPRFEEFKDIFMYDFQQLLNTMNYSCLVNSNSKMLNLIEVENYDCHNMIVFLLNGIDLMASPYFNMNDLSYLRTGFWYAQQMARIGNWLSTWKREIKERDFSSGVFAYAFSNKIIDFTDIDTLSDAEIVNRIENSGMNEYFMKVWKENYVKLASVGKMIHSVDMNTYLIGLQNVIKYHMASEGLK